MAMFLLRGMAHDTRVHHLAFLFPRTSMEIETTATGEAAEELQTGEMHQSGRYYQTPALRIHIHQARFQDPDIDLIGSDRVILAVDTCPMTPIISLSIAHAVLQAINIRCEHPERFVNDEGIIDFDVMDVIGDRHCFMEQVDREQHPEKYQPRCDE